MDIIIAFKYFTSLFKVSKSYLLVSFIISFVVSLISKLTLENIYNYILLKNMFDPLIIISVLLAISILFILVDLFLGIRAAKKNKEVITSAGWEKTIGKFLGVGLYLVIAIVVLIYSVNIVALTFIYTPLFLTILKEFTSIGENLEKITGSKPYLFTVIDKVFEILELKFFNKLKE